MIVRFYGRSERSKLTRSDIKALRAELKSAVNDIIAKSNEAGGRKSGGNFASEIFVIPVRLYQILLSPMFPPSCRFSPSCSEYAIEALRKYGIIRGSLKAVWRVLRCNPFSAGGYDPA
ncbi:MAG: membrane protein insertion efficiency factor YidD [Candidatus Coatesbacteria bacterium]|nr:MAG: membrane protein insertion efficiency factor YidD [Candidatus Coatesbacteria bacterium]